MSLGLLLPRWPLAFWAYALFFMRHARVVDYLPVEVVSPKCTIRPVDGGSAWPERAGSFLLQRNACYLTDD